MIRHFVHAIPLTTLVLIGTLACPVIAHASDDTESALQGITTYEFGQSRQPLSKVAELVRASQDDAKQRVELANRLAGLLELETTFDCKQFVCRQLALIGGPEQVRTLAKLFADEKLADVARLALDAIPGDEAAAALRSQLNTASGNARIGIIQSLSQRRDANSVKPLAALVLDPHTEVAQPAALALGNIGGAEAMAVLAKAKDETKGRLQQLVWEGYLRGADRLAADGEVEKSLAIYEEALAAAEPTSLRPMALAAVARITPTGSLTEDDAGFVPLFNENDFTGWYGDIEDGWRVENGVMICEGNSIWSDAEYGDFILRFDFRLTPNANNGLGIRLPHAGFAAYDCMELQINDDSGDEWQHLQDYQRHGAVYGIAPPKIGHLKPVGQWNSQEIIAHGRQITIKLNGVTILDVDLDIAARLGMLDGLDHLHFPGFYRASGCLNFQGHGSRSEFRNVRIRTITTPRPPGPEYEGFVDLFNGNDLTGWQERFTNGNVAEEPSWHVHDRSLVSGANLLYVMPRQFEDFILRFRFKQSSGSDSGLLLRTATPPGVPGMEIQIRDDTASNNGDANERHGSIVGIAPAAGEHLRPVGQWNVQEVIARGGQITVNLNGKTILEKNVWELGEKLDEQQHKANAGLTRSIGYIALLGHGDDKEHPTEFCNIRIKEL
jgi:hypothetical protein